MHFHMSKGLLQIMVHLFTADPLICESKILIDFIKSRHEKVKTISGCRPDECNLVQVQYANPKQT